MKETTINPLPTTTWNWVKINSAPFATDAQTVDMLPKISGISAGITFAENARNKLPLVAGIETSAGKNSDDLFSTAAPIAVTAEKNTAALEPVLLTYDVRDGSETAVTQIIHAKENSSLTVIITVKSEKSASGFQAQRTYCIAEKNASIHLVKVQLLGDNFRQVDDTGAVSKENACVRYTQVTLGGGEVFTGAVGAVAAYKSRYYSDTAYIARNNQVLDMNYIVRQIGQKSDSFMWVKGTVAGTAKKTYRGSIDFVPGCKGAYGEEQEETLLLSPTAVNKSIPLILCGEDDIGGEHGATIGRLNDDMLFYMEARGIDRATAESLHARAKVQSIANLIEHEATVSEINAYLNGVYGENA